eukprot:TRINITY_DN15105_c0_g1_i1.p1 TRINITY_DN15105_c0_g1~~TRINITY_DN15105_c0_g1_i1.p1  ORF type:complete len:215 (-),score=61.60 TRINITY_DN15105_c0_g1_i1:62-643(-)
MAMRRTLLQLAALAVSASALTVSTPKLAQKTAQFVTRARTERLENEEAVISANVKGLEGELAEKEIQQQGPVATKGKLTVNGPIPADFSERLAQAAAKAVPCAVTDVKVVESYALDKDGDRVEIVFEGPKDVVEAVEDQSAEPHSALLNSPLRDFLVAEGSPAAARKYGEAPEVVIEKSEGKMSPLHHLQPLA